MTPYVARTDITGDLTLLELIGFFRLGAKSIGRDKQRWFAFNYDYYDGLHINLTIFGIYFYSHY